jgi:OmpA-OmpF porin, OOP family
MTILRFTVLFMLSALLVPGLKSDPIDTGPYLVFFGWDSATLSDESKNTLQAAVGSYKVNGERLHLTIQLAGYADRSGEERYNQALADRRIDSVRAYFESKGIAADRFEPKSFGEDVRGLREATADGVRSQQNRRVEVFFQPHLPGIN